MGWAARRRRAAEDGAAALGLLTRLPVRVPEDASMARAAWAWPLAGLATGGLAALAGWLALGLGLPPGLAAGLMLAVSVLATGALHEDGLADVADGFWGGFTPARRLEIMRDSRVGSYGVIALVLSLGLRWSALAALAAAGWLWPVVAAAALSRAPMAAVMRALPPARADGLSRGVGRPGARGVALGALLALGAALVLAGVPGLLAALAAAAAALAMAALARAKIGGQTGDVLGAVQQLAEVAALGVLAAAV
jgi:adenosylcobinamide-GDP ribazoletransferase